MEKILVETSEPNTKTSQNETTCTELQVGSKRASIAEAAIIRLEATLLLGGQLFKWKAEIVLHCLVASR